MATGLSDAPRHIGKPHVEGDEPSWPLHTEEDGNEPAPDLASEQAGESAPVDRDLWKQVGGYLKERRRSIRPRLSQEAVARSANLSLVYLQKIEQGRAANPSGDVLSRIGTALNLESPEIDRLVSLANRMNRHRSAVVTVEVRNRVGIIHDLTEVVAGEGITIRALGTWVQGDTATAWVTMEPPDRDQWTHIEVGIRRIEEVDDVTCTERDEPRRPSSQRAGNAFVAASPSMPGSVESAATSRPVVPMGWPHPSEVTVVAHALDRVGLVRDLTAVIAEEGLDIKELGTSTRDDEAVVWFTMDRPAHEQWSRIETQLRSVPQVFDVASLARDPSSG